MKPILLLLTVCLSLPTLALGRTFGPSTSGGGIAVVCRDPSNVITSVELLDIYEARGYYGFRVPQPLGSIEADYIRSVRNTYRLQGFPEAAADQFSRTNLARFLNIIEFTAPGEKLRETNDSGRTPPLSHGCTLEQLAIFHDQTPQRVQVDVSLWQKLDSLNQAALVTHEALYAYQREANERTSENSRAFVAHVFTEVGGGPVPVSEGIPAGSADCLFQTAGVAPDFQRYSSAAVYSPSPSLLISEMRFSHLAGYGFVTQATARIPKFPWNTRTEIRGLQPVDVVTDAGYNEVARAPVVTTQGKNWEIEIRYVTGQPVTLAVYQNGQLITESLLSGCHQR